MGPKTCCQRSLKVDMIQSYKVVLSVTTIYLHVIIARILFAKSTRAARMPTQTVSTPETPHFHALVRLCRQTPSHLGASKHYPQDTERARNPHTNTQAHTPLVLSPCLDVHTRDTQTRVAIAMWSQHNTQHTICSH